MVFLHTQVNIPMNTYMYIDHFIVVLDILSHCVDI